MKAKTVISVPAVQHERGPRKPKLQQSSGNQLHHSAPLQHPFQHNGPPGADTKLPPAGAFHFNPGLFAPPHHPLKGLVLPPPPPQPPVSSPPGVDAAIATSGFSLPVFHHAALPPPPGLLHILMSAEKCQVIPTNNDPKKNYVNIRKIDFISFEFDSSPTSGLSRTSVFLFPLFYFSHSFITISEIRKVMKIFLSMFQYILSSYHYIT